jgi:hypothetical protein
MDGCIIFHNPDFSVVFFRSTLRSCSLEIEEVEAHAGLPGSIYN